MKELKDYLHLYLGCEVKHQSFVKPLILKSVSVTGIRVGGSDGGDDSYNTLIENIKPILRPLSDMTEEIFLSLFKLSMGWYEDAQVTKFKRWSSSELYVRTGYAQYIFGFVAGLDNDVRVPQGISFFLKSYLIQPTLEVSESGITESESYWNNQDRLLAGNQSEIFNRLRKSGFDCDGLIESSLAINSKQK